MSTYSHNVTCSMEDQKFNHTATCTTARHITVYVYVHTHSEHKYIHMVARLQRSGTLQVHTHGRKLSLLILVE